MVTGYEATQYRIVADSLPRIATALERIADALEKQPEPKAEEPAWEVKATFFASHENPDRYVYWGGKWWFVDHNHRFVRLGYSKMESVIVELWDSNGQWLVPQREDPPLDRADVIQPGDSRLDEEHMRRYGGSSVEGVRP